MKETREFYRDGGDEMNQYLIPVGLGKFLAYLLPVSERIEWMCVEVFGMEGKPKETLEKRGIDASLNQILKCVSVNLHSFIENENQSPFLLQSQIDLLDLAMQHGGILMRNSVLFRLFLSEKNEIEATWNAFARDIQRHIHETIVEPRYCGVLKPVRILPCVADRIVESQQLCRVVTDRLKQVLDKNGPMNNRIREIHIELNQSIPNSAAKPADAEAACDPFGLLVEMGKAVRAKVQEIAGMGPKYTNLILMENLQFLESTMELRLIDALSGEVESWKSSYQEVGFFLAVFWVLMCRRNRTIWMSKFAISSRALRISTMPQSSMSRPNPKSRCRSRCRSRRLRRARRWGR